MKFFYSRSMFVTLFTVTMLLVTPLTTLAQDEIVTGLGETSYGWSEFRDDAGTNYAHLAWRQAPWDWYNFTSGCTGETRAAAGDVDGGGQTETIYGLESCGNGWFQIRDDSSTSYDHLAWRQVPWSAYNDCNGETWPAAGNLDNAGNDEIVIGLGPCANGWFEIRYDSANSYNHRSWRQVPWDAYNNRNGETRPAVGDLDGGGEAEIVIGLGATGYGWFEIRDGAAGSYGHIAWLQVPWTWYNDNCGGTRPALGDVDNDGRDEIVIGLDYPCNSGYFAIFDDATTNYRFLGWRQVLWSNYNNCIGETRPAVGDVDGGGWEEIVIGLGPYRVCSGLSYPNGWYEIFEDAGSNFNHKAWLQVNWDAYNLRNGETWPAVGNTTAGLVAAATSGETAEAENSIQSEPASSEPQIFPALLQGPPANEMSASAIQGPVAEADYYAGPEAIELDPALAPPGTTTFYAGPAQPDTYYAGPVIVELANKAFLPLVQTK